MPLALAVPPWMAPPGTRLTHTAADTGCPGLARPALPRAHPLCCGLAAPTLLPCPPCLWGHCGSLAPSPGTGGESWRSQCLEQVHSAEDMKWGPILTSREDGCPQRGSVDSGKVPKGILFLLIFPRRLLSLKASNWPMRTHVHWPPTSRKYQGSFS